MYYIYHFTSTVNKVLCQHDSSPEEAVFNHIAIAPVFIFCKGLFLDCYDVPDWVIEDLTSEY